MFVSVLILFAALGKVMYMLFCFLSLFVLFCFCLVVNIVYRTTIKIRRPILNNYILKTIILGIISIVSN